MQNAKNKNSALKGCLSIKNYFNKFRNDLGT